MGDKFSTRLARRSDRQAISDLLLKSYGHSFQQNYSKALLHQVLPLVTAANMSLLSSGQYHVAELPGGKIIGCGGWSFLNPESRRTAPGLVHVRHFATDIDYGGQGVGKTILATCLADAYRDKGKRVECFSSLNAVGFYEKCGFLKVRPIDVHITDIITFPTMLMGKDLP